jgi:hypothetical protein
VEIFSWPGSEVKNHQLTHRPAMDKHFIHYLPRRITKRFPHDASAPWFADAQSVESGFSRPAYHTTRRINGPSRSVGPGDSIWIISQLFSPWGPLPPAVDSRIDVNRLTEGRDGIKFHAASTSSWFPLYDATKVLHALETVDAGGRVLRLRNTDAIPIGQQLQSMRRLKNHEQLIAHSLNLSTRPLNFISYRVIDGTFGAFRKAKDLLKKGEAVFWDRWSLPRRLAERREIVSNSRLNRHLMEELTHCDVVWGIESPLYAEPKSYSAMEKAVAISLGKYQSVKQTITAG